MARRRVLFFVVVLLFFGFLWSNVSTFLMDKLIEESTVELSAVVARVDCVVTEESTYWIIHVRKPDGALLISASVGGTLDAADMETLTAGTPITFRMEPSAARQYQEAGSGQIVALRAERVIFSLEAYNEIMHRATLPAEIAGAVIQLLLLLLLLHLGRKAQIGQLFRRR